MSNEIECKTQAELEAAIGGTKTIVLVAGIFSLVLNGIQSPNFILKGSVALSIVAWGSSQPHIEAWGSSQPHIVARENSQPHIVASMNVQLQIRGNVSGTANKLTAINVWGAKKSKIKGGRQLQIRLNTPKLWCDYYGVEIKNGKALLFKGLNSNFKSERGGDYAPGTIPICGDWDGGKIECGRGYHVSPSPRHTHEFCTPKKYVAGWVKLADMAVHEDGDYPQKCKIHKYASPVWECDADGNLVEAPS